MSDAAFNNFSKANNCPSGTIDSIYGLEQAEENLVIVENVISKARLVLNDDIAFCNKEKAYYNKIVQKYSPYNTN